MRAAISPPVLGTLLLLGLAWHGAGRCPVAGLGCEACELRHLALAHAFHHLLHLLAGLEQPVDLLHRGTAALRDPNPALAVDHVRRVSLVRRHREHDRLDFLQSFSSMSTSLSWEPIPGISFSTPCSGPILRNMRCAERK